MAALKELCANIIANPMTSERKAARKSARRNSAEPSIATPAKAPEEVEQKPVTRPFGSRKHDVLYVHSRPNSLVVFNTAVEVRDISFEGSFSSETSLPANAGEVAPVAQEDDPDVSIDYSMRADPNTSTFNTEDEEILAAAEGTEPRVISSANDAVTVDVVDEADISRFVQEIQLINGSAEKLASRVVTFDPDVLMYEFWSEDDGIADEYMTERAGGTPPPRKPPQYGIELDLETVAKKYEAAPSFQQMLEHEEEVGVLRVQLAIARGEIDQLRREARKRDADGFQKHELQAERILRLHTEGLLNAMTEVLEAERKAKLAAESRCLELQRELAQLNPRKQSRLQAQTASPNKTP